MAQTALDTGIASAGRSRGCHRSGRGSAAFRGACRSSRTPVRFRPENRSGGQPMVMPSTGRHPARGDDKVEARARRERVSISRLGHGRSQDRPACRHRLLDEKRQDRITFSEMLILRPACSPERTQFVTLTARRHAGVAQPGLCHYVRGGQCDQPRRHHRAAGKDHVALRHIQPGGNFMKRPSRGTSDPGDGRAVITGFRRRHRLKDDGVRAVGTTAR